MGVFGKKKNKAEEEMKMRALILRERLSHHPEIEEWMASSEDAFEAFGNHRLATFFNEHFDGREVLKRFTLYNKQVQNDQDHVRLHGQYYNNIYLGKRIFGPARKQVFAHTVVGGMERRFEIIDSQVNHIPFSHEASDKYREKCRNPRIKCRDDTRVVLRFPAKEPHNFIHANRVASPLLFNDFILTQAPMESTVGDFWRMIWQERVRYIFMLVDRTDPKRCAVYWPRRPESGPLRVHGLSIVNEGVDDLREPHFRVTRLRVVDAQGTELRVEHWQGDLNNSDNLHTPLRLLRLARNCTFPTVVHDHLGVSRASCLVAVELCLANLLKGPAYKYPVQRAVHFLRSFRSFAVETPMQYIFIHRVVQHFIQPFVGSAAAFDADYHRWLEERSQRLFVDDLHGEIPAYRLLSPKIDPDLLPLARRRERPEHRREIHSNVGELPLPLERPSVNQALVLPKRYPKGRRY